MKLITVMLLMLLATSSHAWQQIQGLTINPSTGQTEFTYGQINGNGRVRSLSTNTIDSDGNVRFGYGTINRNEYSGTEYGTGNNDFLYQYYRLQDQLNR